MRELLSYHVKNKVYVTKRSRVILLNPVSKAEKDNFEINRNDIVLHDKQLASGHFWDLTKGSLQLPVTVKSYKESVSETVKQEFLAEAEILKKFNHPNIVRLIGVCTDRDPFLMGTYKYILSKKLTIFEMKLQFQPIANKDAWKKIPEASEIPVLRCSTN